MAYSSKAAAKKGGIRSIFNTYKADIRFVNVTQDIIKANFDKFFTIVNLDKGFTLEEAVNTDTQALRVFEAKVDPMDEQYIRDFGVCICPNCNIHLSNGVQTRTNMLHDATGSARKHILTMKKEYLCLACDHEFGPDVVKAPVQAPVQNPGTGLKIEKARDEQNGIKRPSIGGACRAVWDACDAFKVATGRSPLPKEIKDLASEEGWNVNNAVIEMYQWRKFNGIVGRVKA